MTASNPPKGIAKKPMRKQLRHRKVRKESPRIKSIRGLI